eukprot:1501056-Amphidinium_carterae.1
MLSDATVLFLHRQHGQEDAINGCSSRHPQPLKHTLQLKSSWSHGKSPGKPTGSTHIHSSPCPIALCFMGCVLIYGLPVMMKRPAYVQCPASGGNSEGFLTNQMHFWYKQSRLHCQYRVKCFMHIYESDMSSIFAESSAAHELVRAVQGARLRRLMSQDM